MAGTPETVVLDSQKPRLEEAQADALRSKMLMETIGTAGKEVIDAANAYEENKQKKNAQDLAAITMAGTLSGGMDKLPQDTKNRIPGILGFDLPKDDQGNVQITPDAETVIKRMTLDQIQKNPDLAMVAAKLQDPRADPTTIEANVRLKKMQLESDNAKAAQEHADRMAENATKIQVADKEAQSRRDVATITAGAESKKANAPKPEDQPSLFTLDPHNGTLVSEPQWYAAHPGEQMPPKLTIRNASQVAEVQKGQAAMDASASTVKANNARIDNLQFTLVKAMSDPDPNNLTSKKIKNLTELSKVAVGTGLGAEMAQSIIERELPDILKSQGWDDESIKATMAMTGPGGLHSILNSIGNYMTGTTAAASGPSARQPLTSEIPGMNPMRGSGDTPTTVVTPGKGKVLNEQESMKFLGM